MFRVGGAGWLRGLLAGVLVVGVAMAMSGCRPVCEALGLDTARIPAVEDLDLSDEVKVLTDRTWCGMGKGADCHLNAVIVGAEGQAEGPLLDRLIDRSTARGWQLEDGQHACRDGECLWLTPGSWLTPFPDQVAGLPEPLIDGRQDFVLVSVRTFPRDCG